MSDKKQFCEPDKWGQMPSPETVAEQQRFLRQCMNEPKAAEGMTLTDDTSPEIKLWRAARDAGYAAGAADLASVTKQRDAAVLRVEQLRWNLMEVRSKISQMLLNDLPPPPEKMT